MKRNWFHVLIALGAAAAFAAAIAWPALALLIECIRDAALPADGFQPGMRQWHLLARTTALAAGAVVACVAFSIPAIWAIGRTGVGVGRGIMFFGAALLLCPPMVYAFGWDRAVPWLDSPSLRCILVWSLWAWAVPAWIIGSAWSQRRSGFHEAALMEASGLRSWFSIAVPTLRTHIALSAVILFVLFFNDYGVPHACGLTVYATELLGWATSSARPIDTVAPALPSVGVNMLALFIALSLWRKRSAGLDANVSPKRPGQRSMVPVLAITGMFVVSWVVPIGVLVGDATRQDFITALRTYSFDILGSLGAASAAGILVVWIAVAAWPHTACRRVALISAIAFGALPGALIGEALIAAYNRAGFDPVYGHWPILSIGYVARFAWIGLCLAGALHRQTTTALIEQATTDGASRSGVLRYVALPMHWATLVAGAGLVTALGVGELPVASMIRPPGLSPISLVIIEKFHRFEDGLLIALSLILVGVGLIAACCWVIARHRQEQFTG